MSKQTMNTREFNLYVSAALLYATSSDNIDQDGYVIWDNVSHDLHDVNELGDYRKQDIKRVMDAARTKAGSPNLKMTDGIVEQVEKLMQPVVEEIEARNEDELWVVLCRDEYGQYGTAPGPWSTVAFCEDYESGQAVLRECKEKNIFCGYKLERARAHS